MVSAVSTGLLESIQRGEKLQGQKLSTFLRENLRGNHMQTGQTGQTNKQQKISESHRHCFFYSLPPPEFKIKMPSTVTHLYRFQYETVSDPPRGVCS